MTIAPLLVSNLALKVAGACSLRSFGVRSFAFDKSTPLPCAYALPATNAIPAIAINTRFMFAPCGPSQTGPLYFVLLTSYFSRLTFTSQIQSALAGQHRFAADAYHIDITVVDSNGNVDVAR